MKHLALANLTNQQVTIWVDDRRIPIGPNSQSELLTEELAKKALEWAKKNGLNVVPAEQAHQVSAQTAKAVAAVLNLGPVIPLKRFDEKNLLALDKALLLQIAADCGRVEPFAEDTPKKQIVTDLLNLAGPASAPVAEAPEPAPVVPPQPPTPSVIGDTQSEVAAQPQ